MSTNLTMTRGDTLELDLTVFLGDGVTPLNLTGAKLWSTIKHDYDDADEDAVSQVSSTGGSVPVGGGVTITDAVNGLANVKHSPLATSGLDASVQKLVYDVQLKDSLGRVFTIAEGVITVKPDTTQTTT